MNTTKQKTNDLVVRFFDNLLKEKREKRFINLYNSEVANLLDFFIYGEQRFYFKDLEFELNGQLYFK